MTAENIGAPVLDKAPAALTAEQQAAATAAAEAAAAAAKPAMTRSGAQAKIAELKANPKFTERYLNNDPAAVAEFKTLHVTAATPDPATDIGRQVSTLARFGGIEPDSPVGRDLAEVLAGKPITPELRRQVEEKRRAMVNDAAWSKRYFEGDQTARREMATVSTLLGARVATGA